MERRWPLLWLLLLSIDSLPARAALPQWLTKWVSCAAIITYHRDIEATPILTQSSTQFWRDAAFDVTTNYVEAGRSEKVMWESTDHSKYPIENGSEVIASALYEYFGFTTSQPRVTTISGRRVVLKKMMNEWRVIDGHKVKPCDLDTPPNADNADYRRLYFVSVFLDDRFRLGSYANSHFGTHFSLNEFRDAFAAGDDSFFKIDTKAKNLFRQFPTAWLPLDHPWRAPRAEDLTVFQARLRSLSDAHLKAIIALGEWNDPERANKLYEALRARRDVLLTAMASSLPPAPRSELQETLSQVRHGQSEQAPWNRDQAKDYFAARRHLITDQETLLAAFITHEDANVSTATNALRFLGDMERFGFYELPLPTKLGILRRAFGLLQAPSTYPPRDIRVVRQLCFTVITNLLRDGASQLEQDTVDQFLWDQMFQHPRELYAVLEELWDFPDETSKANYARFRDLASRLHRNGQNKTVEILLISLIHSALNYAEEADRQLGRGMGFHNAQRVNSAVLHAAKAIADFSDLEIPRSVVTEKLELAALKTLFEGMVYDNGGHRSLGQNISPHEAFGIDGARRKENASPYQDIRNYLNR